MDLSAMTARMIGEPIAVFCARYIYRGVLAEVGTDAIRLTSPFAVEVSGRATRATPETEDSIPSDLIISLGSIEIVCQPTWAFAGYGGDRNTGKKK